MHAPRRPVRIGLVQNTAQPRWARDISDARRASLLAAVLIAASGCASTLRETPTPPPPGERVEVPWGLDEELLSPKTARILILAEWVRGHMPEKQALDDLAALAARYGGRPAEWRPHDPKRPIRLRRDTTYVVVRYVGDELAYFGLAYEKRAGDRVVRYIDVNQELHRKFRALIPARRLEEQTLIHEYGHLLGLPSYPHGYFPKWPELTEGMHCVNPDCPLAKPRPRAILYNAIRVLFTRTYLEDYCAECRRDIEAGQAHWRKRKP